MYTSGYKKLRFSKRAEEELERRIAETPEEAWERFCAVTGFEPVEEEEGAWEDDPDSEDVYPGSSSARRYEDLPHKPIYYTKPPSKSLSTRKGQGQRAKLVYPPKKKRRYPIHGLEGPEGYKFSPFLKARRAKLVTPRSARFSKTVDLDWKGGGVLEHRQLSIFVDDLNGLDNLLGFAFLQRKQQTNRKSATGRKKPLLYQQQTTPFYYAMETHKEVFHRSWSHAARAANVVKANRQSLVWPDIPWWSHFDDHVVRNHVELCRTPIESVKIHYPDGTDKHSLPHNKKYPTAYEVVELVCIPSSPEIIFAHKPEEKTQSVENKSYYKKVPHFFIRFKRVAYDEEGQELPVSFLGFTRGLSIPVETVLKLIEAVPDFLDDVRSYFAEHVDQVDRAPFYQQHPNPRLHKWGFFVSDELKYNAAELACTFTTSREEAYLTDPSLYTKDCPRFRKKGSQHGISQLHPLYVSRLAALAAGELLWRPEWKVDEAQALEDLNAFKRFEKLTIAASFFVYAFCPALVRVFLDSTQQYRYQTFATRVRKSLEGKKLIKLRFCRGPPSFL